MAIRPWQGPLSVEGVQTGDGRVMVDGCFEWAELPLPLGFIVDGDQHVDLVTEAPTIGTIDTIERRPTGEIWGTGGIDDEIPEGAEVVRRMEAGTAPHGNRWFVSVDPDNWEVEIVMTDAAEADDILLVASGSSGRLPSGATLASSVRAAAGDPDPGENGGEGGEVLFQDSVDEILERYTRLRIRGATLCSVSAFDGAWIELTAAASATAATAPAELPADPYPPLPIPARPPAAWFTLPEPEAGDERLVQQPDGTWAVPLTITDAGQVFGHLARAGQSHRGYTQHVAPPRSSSGYAEFHVGHVICDDGTDVACGPLIVGCDHAALSLNAAGARDHYANSGMGWADVRCVDGEHGPWVVGALRPGLNEADLRVLRSLSLSGDWRGSGGRLELIAGLAVNVPGFPVAREAMAAAARVNEPTAALAAAKIGMDADGAVTAMVAAGMVSRCAECAERARTAAATAQVDAGLTEMLEGVIGLRRALSILERRTRHLEPEAIDAMAARVHAT